MTTHDDELRKLAEEIRDQCLSAAAKAGKKWFDGVIDCMLRFAHEQNVSLREDVGTARDWCSAERARVAEEIAVAIEAKLPHHEGIERSAQIRAAAIARAHKTLPEAGKPADSSCSYSKSAPSTEGASGGSTRYAWRPDDVREQGRRAGLEEAARICEAYAGNLDTGPAVAVRDCERRIRAAANEQRTTDHPTGGVTGERSPDGSNAGPGPISDRQRRLDEFARAAYSRFPYPDEEGRTHQEMWEEAFDQAEKGIAESDRRARDGQ